MALGMVRPQRHRKTGVYLFRQRVPADLVAVVGKQEVVRSLGTKDPAVARARFPAVAAEFEERWKSLRQGLVALSHEQVHALAGEIYREEVVAHRANPGGTELWVFALAFDNLIHSVRQRQRKIPSGLLLTTGWTEAEALARDRYGPRVDDLLARHGLQVSPQDRKRIILATAEAMRDAHAQLRRNAEGDYRPDPQAERFPAPQRFGPPLTMEELWEAYKKSKQISPKTVKRWEPVIQKMVAFVGVRDARDVTEEDLMRWRDHLLESPQPDSKNKKGKPLGPKTVKEVYIAAASAVYGWAKGQGKVKANPAGEIEVTVPKQVESRGKGFTDQEARMILSAALAPPSPLITPEHAAARRWVPWLCAYTGARVNEITQLRGQDVFEDSMVRMENGRKVEVTFYTIKITPEAGSVKTRRFRMVPLHDHLVEQGFIDFVQQRGKGPLFYAPERQKEGVSGQNPTYVRVGQSIALWVRGLGIDDRNVLPNHAWRHRFKTVGRRCGMDSAKLDAIQGHAQANEGGGYGEFPSDALKPEIDKHPRYEVTAAETTDRRRTRRAKKN